MKSFSVAGKAKFKKQPDAVITTSGEVGSTVFVGKALPQTCDFERQNFIFTFEITEISGATYICLGSHLLNTDFFNGFFFH